MCAKNCENRLTQLHTSRCYVWTKTKWVTHSHSSSNSNSTDTFCLNTIDQELNCSAHSELMTSHALGELAGSRRTLPQVQQRAAGGFHGRHLESMTSYQKSDTGNRHVFDQQSCQTSSRSDYKRLSFRLFLKSVAPTRIKRGSTNKMGSYMGNHKPYLCI